MIIFLQNSTLETLMIKLTDILTTTPGIEYHLKHGLALHENIYRYSSEAFIDLFKQARFLYENKQIGLIEADIELILETDIGEYGVFEGNKVPLDLPMIAEEDYDSLEDEIANSEFGMDYNQLGPNEKEWVQDEIENMKLNEAEYQGKEVELNKPKRGGSKKFFVYVKDPKTKNVKKVSFGAKDGGGNLAVKLDDPARRKAFADRHNCKDKKDKTKPGFWACRLGRYWKSLGGSKNYPGFW